MLSKNKKPAWKKKIEALSPNIRKGMIQTLVIPDKNKKNLVVPMGCKIFLYNIELRKFVNQEESAEAGAEGKIIPVIAINIHNAVRKIGNLLLSMNVYVKQLEAQTIIVVDKRLEEFNINIKKQ